MQWTRNIDLYHIKVSFVISIDLLVIYQTVPTAVKFILGSVKRNALAQTAFRQ
jgi:hypothetical protein